MMRQRRDIYVKGIKFLLSSIAMVAMTAHSIYAQCNALPSEISGQVFLDENQNGVKDDANGSSGVLIYAFDQSGNLADQAMSDLLGNYVLDGLTANAFYRIEFRTMPGQLEGPLGVDNRSSIRIAEAGNCDIDYGVVTQEVFYGVDPELAITCFVRGDQSEYTSNATIVSVDHNFNSSSSGRLEADKSGTGSVWGLAYNSENDAIYSASFVKQWSSLKNDPNTGAPMHDAIYKTDVNTGATSLFTRLSDLGIPMTPLTYTDANHCDYGSQVGREGLGGLEISDDEKTLFVVNISGNSVVAIDAFNPTIATTQVFSNLHSVIPALESDELMYPFALEYYKNKLYVGYTVIKDTYSPSASSSSIHVVEYDLANATTNLFFSSSFNKGSWEDNTLINFVLKIQHWFTDMEFINDDEFIIALNDRKGNRYCDPLIKFPDQKGDILVVYNDNGTWTMESAAEVNGRVGREPSNGDGPGGGEFFGDDFFPEDEEYHNEVSLGSVYVVPGRNEVVSAVFDPLLEVYSGGLHRYSTVDGSIQAALELYTDEYVENLGKATGFGGITMLEEKPELELGNYVWNDENKNGKQDPNENGVEGVIIELYNTSCEKIASTTTDANGYYVFNSSNVDEDLDGTFDKVSPYTSYYIALATSQFNVSTSSLFINNKVMLLTDADDGYTSYPDASDSDAKVLTNACSALEGMAAIELTTGDLGSNDHKFDIGLVPPGNFDLALKKEVMTSAFARAGEQATFKITVYNQGEISAKNIMVKDYIPAGLSTNNTLNPNWTIGTEDALFEIDELAPGAQEEILIHFIINSGFSHEDFINYAEIESANDQFNQPGDDIDSSMDGENNDLGGEPFQATDDEVDDDGTIDEDDHDPAALKVFDLALTKKIVSAKSGYVKGDIVQYEFRVYNQGSEAARDVVITDYLPVGLSVVSPSLWSENAGNYDITIPSIQAGQQAIVKLDVEIVSDGSTLDIVNFAEISSAKLASGEVAVDYDSLMDDIQNNDKGGDPYGPTNDEITDDGNIDEDDQDPAHLTLERYDLALIKTTEIQNAQKGGEVEFSITVFNQGTITADKITVVDYIPNHMEFVPSPGWEMNDEIGFPTCEISTINGLLPNTGLAPGQEVTISITCKLMDSSPVGFLVNEAEIIYSEDYNGNDRSMDDFDSTPDYIRLNDAGGQVGTVSDDNTTGTGIDDEDDHDPAQVAVMNLMPNTITCLSNATLDDTGQFVYTFEFESSSDLEFTVLFSFGFETGLNAVGEEPNINDYLLGDQVVTTPLSTTDFVFESPNGDGTSTYSLEGIVLDGISPFVILFSNEVGAVVFDEGASFYNDQNIDGPTGVCAGSTETYSVLDIIGSTYEWILDDGGTIVGPSDEATVTIQWDAVPGGPYQLTLNQVNNDLCLNPASIEVSLGESAGAMACIGDATVSLNGDCSITITEDLLLTSEYDDTNVFTVIITDEQGNMLDEPVLNAEHIGQEMTVKIMDVCSGNSCWTSLTVTDKIKPQFIEQDPLDVDCNLAGNFPTPSATDNCGGNITIELVSETYTTLDCNDDYTTEVTRVFVATDENGNVSDEYTQVINLARIDVDAVEFPENRTVADGNPLFCQQFDVDENGNPSPFDAGIPTYNGAPLYPYMDQYCNVGVDYTDQIISPNGCVEKVMRTWTVFEWYCSESNIATVIQEINIADQVAPQFVVPEDFTITTNLNECIGTATLPMVSPEDDCSEMFEVDIQYPSGFLNNSNGGTVDLDLGENVITYTVYDGCLNSTSQSFTITVQDNTVPVMVCDGNTVISLKDDGTAYAPASVFDDGSVTDCSPLTLEVKRMDNGAGCGISNFAFGEFVEFCCADVGQEVMILLRATDEDGNSNTCMVSTTVQDKNPPQIEVPANVTIQCTDTYDLEDLASDFGEATATDNCMNSTITESSIVNISSCNVGSITRIFTASDGNGTATGIQVITIENDFAFNESNIQWPQDFTTDAGCNAGDLQPEDLSAPFDMPVITSDACDNISINSTDQTFTTSDDACFKIIRKWTVLDHCQLDDMGLPLTFEYDQTIVVTNNVAPEIVTSCEPVSVTITDSCEEGEITLGAGAIDDCTADENLVNAYFIDLDNDGSFDMQEAGSGNIISLTEILPVGNHRIVYTFEDRCGNEETCTQLFSIIANVPPIAYCQDLAIELTPMDTDGDGVVDAEMTFLDVELIGGSSESPCDFPFTLSYDVEGDSTVATFDCFDLGQNFVTVYVTDIFGNQTSCVASVIVQDNNDVDICPSPEDCIIPPVENLTITECVDNLNPETIGGSVIVETPCVCEDFTITYEDTEISSPGDACFDFERVYTVTFNCEFSPVSYSYTQIVKQFNASAPIIESCPADGVGMATTMDCTDFVELGLPVVNTLCSTGITITNDSEFADSNTGAASGNYPVGTTVVIYTVTDQCGNASTCSLEVVVDDESAPVCNTMDITVTIPSDGSTVFIEGEDIDNNSMDDCGMIVDYDATPSSFDCDDLGDNTVELLVTDQSGNTSICFAIVTVVDEVAPVCMTQNLEFTLTDAAQVITISGEDLDNGSSDACGIIVDYDATPNTFSCDDIGVNAVTLTVTDDSGNTSICDATVTILDGVAPLCVTQDITVTLDGSNMYTLEASEVDNGSSDVCGDNVSLSVTPNQFDCDDLGDNTVTLTVTDDAGNTSQCTALVTVLDTVPPVALCADPGVVTVTLFNSTFPTPIPVTFVDNGSFDVCGEIASIELDPPTASCDDIGDLTVVLIVTDNNGNVGTCETVVTVQDAVDPVAVCNDGITVSIEMDGQVEVDPLDIDDGSFDNCGMIVDYSLTPNVFDCDDLGVNTVILTVTDNSGNTSTCESTVTVESNDELVAVCQDITVFLGDGVSAPVAVTIVAEDVDGGSMIPCGNEGTLTIDDSEFDCNNLGTNPNEVQLIVTDNTTGEMDTCIALVTVVDTIPPSVECPADLTLTCEDDISNPFAFGEPIFSDNCLGSSMQDTIVVEDLDECGLGTVTVTYIVTDLSGNSAECTHTITVEVSGDDLFSEANIIWPVDTLNVIDCSSLEPADLMSMPEIDTMNAICFNLVIEFNDVSQGTGTTCQDTIERTWTVDNTCDELDPFTFVQIIIVDDSGAPLFEGLPTDTLLVTESTICGAFVDLSGLTVTDCTTDLIITNDSPVAPNDQLDASGTYPAGVTTVNYTAQDGCGNISTFAISIEIEDLTDPEATCIKVFPEIQSNDLATVVPEDYIMFASDNCTDSMDLEIIFVLDYVEGDDDLTDNMLVETITFDCDDVGILQVVFVAIIDEAGNSFVCGAQTTVIDPNDFCSNSPNGLVQGQVETHYGTPVQSTALYLEGDMEDMEMVENTGAYAFDNITEGDDVNLTPFNDEEPAAGITTLDILLIQKHILGLQILPTPYDIIAADADNNEVVNGVDIIQIQKIILGTYTEFPNNNSFRFVDASYAFNDPTNPFASTFPENAVLNDIQGPIQQDFVGVKVGDVNGTFSGFETNEDGPDGESIIAGVRSKHNLYLDDAMIHPVNGFVHIPIYSDEFNELQALEMTLETKGLKVDRIMPGAVNLTSSDYHIDRNEIKISWVYNSPVQISSSEELFTIVVRSDEAVDAQAIVSMKNDVNEFYSSGLDIASLRFVNRNEALKAVLHQNVPNPWTDRTIIEFEMVTDADYTFNFYDVDGRLLLSKSGYASKGVNTIEINKNEMSVNSGVIVYEFISGYRKLTKRMMLME